MKLGDILAVISECNKVDVIDITTQETIARYDGKNSIDSKLNAMEVTHILSLHDGEFDTKIAVLVY